jgi:hypothetical protein
MSGRLSPDPEAAVSARYYGAVTTEHLDRLARLAAAERERFARRWPRDRDRFLAVTLAQGAALHMLTGSTGVKDLDVVLLFATLPGERFPEFPRLVKHVDFGPSSLGRQAYERAAARDDRQRRQWADQHRGRRVDLVKRALPASPGANPVEVIRSWLRADRAARRTSSAFYLAQKPVVLLDPPASTAHSPGAGPMSQAERGHAMMAGCPAVPDRFRGRRTRLAHATHASNRTPRYACCGGCTVTPRSACRSAALRAFSLDIRGHSA